MAGELEELIENLVLHIACAGEQGYLVKDILQVIQQSSAALYATAPSFVKDQQSGSNATRPFEQRTVATLWKWLVAREDVLVGRDGQYNHLTLDELLALEPQGVQEAAASSTLDPTPSTQDPNAANSGQDQSAEEHSLSTTSPHIKVYTSAETTWRSITGHSVDFKRVHKLEWDLLQGIARSRWDGIVQGDVRRLVNQDKRSVPKRTEALASKGYIIKRTTLVRGTKTSKLWLKCFAPSLRREGAIDEDSGPAMNFSRQVLAGNLDPVPWHTRWSLDAIDFKAMASTLVAITKEWGVIRMQDLKMKLGVLNQQWQMRNLAKTCRFLARQGVIQYVAAILNDKLFKDCVKYARDLNAEDWRLYLATGKRATRRSKAIEKNTAGVEEEAEEDNLLATQDDSTQLSQLPPWSPDKPLSTAVTTIVAASGASGLTNTAICAATIGTSFSRYIASLTSALSTPDIQPPPLKHLQMESEHVRSGKIASYRYFLRHGRLGDSDTGANAQDEASMSSSSNQPATARTPASKYGFCTPLCEPQVGAVVESLSDICLRHLPNRKRGRPKKAKASEGKSQDYSVEQLTNDNPQKTVREGIPEAAAGGGIDGGAMSTVDLENRAGFAASPVDQQPQSPDAVADMEPEPGPQTAEDVPTVEDDIPDAAGDVAKAPEDEADKAGDEAVSGGQDLGRGRTPGRGKGRGRGRGKRGAPGGRGRGRGRGRPKVSDLAADTKTLSTHPWQCDKCGGAWKNEGGLQYHQTKSRTSCNPSYVEPPPPPTGSRPRKPYFETSMRRSERAHQPPEERPDEEEIETKETRQRSPTPPSSVAEESEQQPPLSPSPAASTPGTPISYAPPTIVQSALISVDSATPRQLSALQNLTSKHTATNVELVDAPVGLWVESEGAQNEDIEAHNKQEQEEGDALRLPQTPRYKEDNLASATTSGPPDSRHMGSQRANEPMSSDLNPRTRLRNIILDVVRTGNGMILGGNSLWQTVAEIWSTSFPSDTLPTTRLMKAVLGGMIRHNMIKEQWHGFRGVSGRFSKCQIVTLPGMDAFSQDALRLVDQVKQAGIELLDMKERPHRNSRTARRSLPDEVAVLDAPVYAAQVAPKRRPQRVLTSPGQSKRRRLSYDLGLVPEDEALPPFGESRFQWAAGRGLSADEEHLLADRANSPFMQPMSASVEFLLPNTHLEDDDLEPELQPPQLLARGRPRRKQTKAPYDDFLDISSGIAVVEPNAVVGAQNGSWPSLDTAYFERLGGSWTLNGWLPDEQWLAWVTLGPAIDQRLSYLRRADELITNRQEQQHRRFLQRLLAGLEVEESWANFFVASRPGSAGPHNIFVRVAGPSTSGVTDVPPLTWCEDNILTTASMPLGYTEQGNVALSSSDEDLEDIHALKKPRRKQRIASAIAKVKRIELVTRELTTLPANVVDDQQTRFEEVELTGHVDNRTEVLAAFVATRALLGGVEKAIDWGLLAHIFPELGVANLRKFWASVRKEQAPSIAKFTQAFHTHFLMAYENEELPPLDFDKPLDYDWQGLIQWTMQIPYQEGLDLPESMTAMDKYFTLSDLPKVEDDWREKFFHVQSSVFGRLEAATLEPGAISMSEFPTGPVEEATITELDVGISWIKSLCCTAESRYSPAQVKDRFLSLSSHSPQRRNAFLKGAIDQLTTRKVICKSKKPPLGGRPYRLNEWFVFIAKRLAHRAKFREAAVFKAKLDAVFRRGETFKVPYTVNDGAAMALTNLNAHGRIRLAMVDVPYIPLGFDPGNYESRKHPKSSYHFGLEATPTETYLYNDSIDTLGAAAREPPPAAGRQGEVPHWIDFFGQTDHARWSDMLGAFCFLFATRGPMTIEGICSAMDPLLEPFEALAIMAWGKRTGVLRDTIEGAGVNVGEWWWLAVPLQRR